MGSKKASKGKGRLTPPPGEAPRALVPRTKRELETYASKTVREGNLLLQEAGNKHYAAAVFFFDSLFGGDALRALDLGRDPTPEYLAARAHEGRMLDLAGGELSVHVRVGAISKLLAGDDRWSKLDWWKQLALVPLVIPGGHLGLLEKGLKVAWAKGVTRTALTQWVGDHKPRQNLGRPAGQVTLATGHTLADAGTKLDDDEAVAQLAGRIRDLPPEKRRALTKDLRKAALNLQRLLDQVGDDED